MALFDANVDPRDRVEAWIEFARGCPGLIGSNLYQNEAISPTSVFLFTRTTCPLPYATSSGCWFSYPGLRALLNHLRFVVLVSHWGTWLCRDEWDPSFSDLHLAPLALDVLFSRAREARCPNLSDVPRMERIASALEAGTWEALQGAVGAFNRRWKSTPTWDFTLRVFDSPVPLGRHLWTHDACGSVTATDRRTWLDTCARAVSEDSASAELIEVLRDACAL